MNYLHLLAAGLTLTICATSGCTTRTVQNNQNIDVNREQKASIEKKDRKGQLNSMESQGIALIKKVELDRAYKIYEKIAGLSYYRGRGECITPLAMMLQDIHDYGDMSRCVQWCKDFSENNPSLVNTSAAHNMAVIFAKTNRFEEALAIMKPHLDEPGIDLDFVHDYGMYCLDVLEHNKVEDSSHRKKMLARAWRSVEIIGEKWGKNQRYYIALGEYYTVLRDFEKAKAAYEKSIEQAKTGKDQQEIQVQVAEASLLRFELGILTHTLKGNLTHLDNMMKAFEGLEPDTFDRFYVDRPFAMLLSEFYMNHKPIASWQVKKIIDEHKNMEKKGMHQPRQLKVLYNEIYLFLVNREKGDNRQALHHLRRVIAYFKVTQDCPAYHPVHIPVTVSMLYGLKGELYHQEGDTVKAVNSYEKSLEYFPGNRISQREIKRLAQ